MKAFRTLALILVLTTLVLLVASCAHISGTYGTENANYEFKSDGTVIYSFKILSATTSFTYNYKIDEDEILMWDEDETEEDADSYSFNKGKDNDGAYVEIGGIKYYEM